MCDRALWLDEGRLVMDGPADEVVDAYAKSRGPRRSTKKAPAKKAATKKTATKKPPAEQQPADKTVADEPTGNGQGRPSEDTTPVEKAPEKAKDQPGTSDTKTSAANSAERDGTP